MRTRPIFKEHEGKSQSTLPLTVAAVVAVMAAVALVHVVLVVVVLLVVLETDATEGC